MYRIHTVNNLCEAFNISIHKMSLKSTLLNYHISGGGLHDLNKNLFVQSSESVVDKPE